MYITDFEGIFAQQKFISTFNKFTNTYCEIEKLRDSS